jgi:hypothetical protein
MFGNNNIVSDLLIKIHIHQLNQIDMHLIRENILILSLIKFIEMHLNI